MSPPWTRIATHVESPAAPPAGEVDRFWYGVAQPFFGLRLLINQRELFHLALLPVLAVLGLAALAVSTDDDGLRDQALHYYATVTTLSSVPAIVFAGRYAQLARLAAERLQLPSFPLAPESLFSRVKHFVRQAILLAIGILPLLMIAALVPLLGDLLVLALTGAWTLHWIVVEALDGARVVDPPGETAPRPWFVAWTDAPVLDRVPVARRFARWFGVKVTQLARPWAEEVALVRRHPALAVGFGLAAAAILAIPLANLLLRPAILIGAVHLRGQLRQGS
jgi:hypothetical protein